MTAIVKLRDLAIGYPPKKPLLKDVNATALRGTMTAVLGRNGVGKSTLLRTLSGLQSPLQGSIRMADRELTGVPVAQRASMIALVLTKAPPRSNMSVLELVALGRFPYTNWLGDLSEPDRQQVRASLEAVGLAGFEQRVLLELSDGELQKAMIARALAQDADVLILDEPTAFLDALNRSRIMRLLAVLCEQGKTVILSTHEIGLALKYAGACWVLTGEGNMVVGSPAELTAAGLFKKEFEWG